MPDISKYKSISVSTEAYEKLVFIAKDQDRAIGRQMSRMIDEKYDEILEAKKQYLVAYKLYG